MPLTLADLDLPGGTQSFAQACSDKSACQPALRFFVQNKNKTLREVLREMCSVNAEASTWPMWAWDQVRDADPAFRLHVLKLGMEMQGNDPALAAHIDLYGGVNASERLFLRGLWHSAHRPDGQVVLPEWEAVAPPLTS